MAVVPTLSFEEARRTVLERVGESRPAVTAETVRLEEALGRVLREEVRADRDAPPLPRSVRDGYAVRAADLPGPLAVIGEVRAGECFPLELQPGQAVEIMTGAPVPAGADCVVMVEHVELHGDLVTCRRAYSAGDHINPRGCDCREGDVVLAPGARIGYAEVAMLASVGRFRVEVAARPRVAILATGDEVVEEAIEPLPYQVRNSNSHSLAAQVMLAGGEPQILPVARDTIEETLELIEHGLAADLLLLSGGVSAGKYDVVELALAQLGAEVYFDRVLIQPGQPAVFGRARGKFFFGLPGNPASTMVCFELFARPAVELLAGRNEAPLALLEAVLAADFSHRPGLTRFLPARLDEESKLHPIAWSGSGDIAALARANCYLVAAPDKAHYQAGERIQVLLR